MTTATPSDRMTSRARFHAERNAEAVRPQGPLALVNTQWIDSAQTVWGVPGRWAPAPEGAAGLLLTAAAADGIRIDDVLVDGTVLVPGMDTSAPARIGFSETVSGYVIRADTGTYGLRVWDAASDAIRSFGSIDVFDDDPAWELAAHFEARPERSVVGYADLHARGVTSEPVVAGDLHLDVAGEEYVLAGYAAAGAVHLVFTDATNGVETYSVGRLLIAPLDDDGTTTVDLNEAMLPPCGFSYNFNCPIPPAQNRFPFPVRAGEKNVLTADGALLH